MTARLSAGWGRTAIVTMAGLFVAVMLVWSASTGPTGLAEGVPTRPVVEDTTTVRGDEPTDQRQAEDSRDAKENVRRLGTGVMWLDDVVGVVAFLAALWALTAIVRSLMNVVSGRLPDKQLVVDLDPLPDLEAGREAVTRDRDRFLEALEASDVRNGIVACWVLLEEEAAEAGVVRRPAETPTEFVVRFLHTLDVDPRPVARLADLYREARFSTHTMGEDARTRAQVALRNVHDELVSTSSTAGSGVGT